MEQSIGADLFVRNSKKVLLTDAGKKLLPQARQMLDLMESMQSQITATTRLSGECRFGISELVALTWLPALINAVRKEHPGLMLKPYVDLARGLEKRVLKGELDFAVAPGPAENDDLASEKIAAVEFTWVASPGRIRPGAVLTSKDLVKYPLITMTEGSGLTRAFERWASEQGMPAQRTVACNSLMGIVGLTMADVGISFLPARFTQPWIERGALAAVRSIPPLPNLNYCFIYRKDDNRAGAGGVIGMTAAARAPADGHTIGLGNLSDLVVSRYAQANVPYDPAKDFAAVATLAKVSIVVTTLPTFPAKSFQEFLALAKANPGKYKCGTAGNGSMGHLCLEALQSAAAIDMVHVPYRGGAPALNDLLGGHIDLLIDGSALSQVKAGKLKALAVTAERIPVLPNVPTVEESGVPGFSFGNYWGLLMPVGSPAAAVTRLNAEIKRLLVQPDIRQQLENAGFSPLASSPLEYSQALQKSYDQIGQLVKKAKITFD